MVPWTATKGETIVAAENIDIANFSKLAATLPKKIFGSQNHFWQLAQAELVEFIPDTKSLAAKTNFGRILPKIFGTANFYFDFFLPSILFCNQQETIHAPIHHTATHTAPSTHNTIFHPKQMLSPPTISTKHWGKVDRAALHDLVFDGSVDITNHTYANIDAVQAEYFPHRTVRNFRRNFKDFSGAFDLKEGLIGARRGMMRVCCFNNYFIYVLLTSRPRRRRRRRHRRH